jgi:hypothetical protein
MAGSPLLVDFDFANLIISGKTDGLIEAGSDLYSDWKELVAVNADGLAAAVPPAFIESKDGNRSVGGSVGGNPLGGGQFISSYYFINNADGWRFRPAEQDGETNIDGNFFPLDASKPFILPTLGGFTHLVRVTVSPQSITTIAAGTGLTAQQELWLKEIHALTAGDAEVSLDDLTVTIYDTNVSPRQVLAVYDISADGRIRTRTS